MQTWRVRVKRHAAVFQTIDIVYIDWSEHIVITMKIQMCWNHLRGVSCGVFVGVWDLSAWHEGVLHPHIIVLPPLRLRITVSAQDTHKHAASASIQHAHADTCHSVGETATVLQRCGPLPLCCSALVVDIVDSAQVVLALLPARGQRRKLLALSATCHVLSLQKLPSVLHSKEKQLKWSQRSTWIKMGAVLFHRTWTIPGLFCRRA